MNHLCACGRFKWEEDDLCSFCAVRAPAFEQKVRENVARYLSDYSVPEDEELISVLTRYVMSLLK